MFNSDQPGLRILAPVDHLGVKGVVFCVLFMQRGREIFCVGLSYGRTGRFTARDGSARPGPGQWSKGFFGLPGINVPLEPDVGLDVKVILMPPVSFIERITDGICRAV